MRRILLIAAFVFLVGALPFVSAEESDRCTADIEQGNLTEACREDPERIVIENWSFDPNEWCLDLGEVEGCQSEFHEFDGDGNEIPLENVTLEGCSDVCNVTLTVRSDDGADASVTGRLDLGDDGLFLGLRMTAVVFGGGLLFLAAVAALYLSRDDEEVPPHEGGRPSRGSPAPASSGTGSKRPEPKRRVPVRAQDTQSGEDLTQRIQVVSQDGKAKARRGPKGMTIAHPGGRAYRIEVRADGYEPASVTVDDSTSIGGLDIELSRQEATLAVEAVNAETDDPIPGLDFVILHNRTRERVKEGKTGELVSASLPFGRYTVSLTVPRFFDVEGPDGVQVRAEGREGAVALELEPGDSRKARFQMIARLPDLELPRDSSQRLEQAVDSLREYDTFVPSFLADLARGFGPSVRQGLAADVEALARSEVLPEQVSNAVHEVQAELVDGIVESVSSRKNQSLFAKTPDQGQPPEPQPLGVAEAGLLIGASDASQVVQRLESELEEADQRLTELSRDLTIRPLADLLSVARRLLKDASPKRNPVETAAKLLAADRCLGGLRQAMDDEAFHPHLQGGRI